MVQKGKVLTYYGRRNLLLVFAGCGCSRFSARLLRQGNRVALRRLPGVKKKHGCNSIGLYPLLSSYNFMYSIVHVVNW